MSAPPLTGSLPTLDAADAETYAAWFACLAEPARVRLLHTVATAPGAVTVGELADALGLRQPTVSHHLRKLAEAGFVTLTKSGTSTRVMVNPDCCSGLPHAADAVMGLLAARPCCPADLPADVAVRAMADTDFPAVLRIYAEGIATGNATFETETPSAEALDAKWLPGHRWVAEIDGEVVGWAAATPVSSRPVYAGVAETSIYVSSAARGRGVGKVLLHRQVTAADSGGLWTLQTAIFPENKASLALHHSAGFRTLGVRERIGRHHGVWRDTVMLERRRDDTRAAGDSGTAEGGC
ncbi:helix-turn-helix domain-containing GNAT family N-acetyltransferase [Streptomonospora nanhaiensis]|uniref:L-amino acid N-acyltransferase YncA/DNA-binding transcriptional ArsR family regulator n=1 Tax=Streptomonospora nanhaiensis TaxID=1323731 RepID=A0A853BN86_9ACTN|nr:metalloregulator ArsR/SmtB family transcription factor [Streptomonospora nanhaiensis]MBV2361975.1 metalloregulator ArsR/SmtB family transcription factor [Streptomonospora nanhaiensis]MBX9386792.1 metalloregulator ArsR/SmtB family transcription factor [Streptomonospora nanhaiensis]NYI96204.1 L-amino acid N-acyltransferase YncA/DNA-binding transcriptional ArsR family regulator [Streptomonospora nanhaiensis]